MARLAAQLAARGGRLGLAVDHLDGIERLAEAMAQHGSDAGIDVLVEIDVGQGRCGVPPGEAAVALALAVSRAPRLRFAGLQAYHGRAQHLASSVGRKEAIAQVVNAAHHTRQLIEAEGLKQISDTGELESIIDEVIAKNPKQLEMYRGGKTTIIGYFVGQVMKATKGQANPAVVNEILAKKLAG